jgi:riboflavin transporter FmnP
MPMRLNAKEITFAAVMAALANILGLFSIGLTRVGQLGIDFSNLTVFIGGIYGGPFLGFLIGLLGGIIPGVEFGPLGGLGWLGLFGLTFGKSLTGLTVGILCRMAGTRRVDFQTILLVLTAYLPESLFTIFFFLGLVPFFIGPAPWFSFGWLISVIVKGWLETLIMAVFLVALMRNTGFSNLIVNILGRSPSIGTKDTAKS